MLKPMMDCGHAANGVDGKGDPVCVICAGLTPGARTIAAEQPDLSSRTAVCSYADQRTGQHSSKGRWGRPTDGPVPSQPGRLAFFQHRPDEAHDRYYCGCWGWD